MPAAMRTAARLGIEERQFELTKFLMAEDPLPMVLRAHLHIEEELIAFIKAQGHAEKAIPSGYARLVELALKLGLPEEFRKQLVVLGRLRNRFAHRQYAAIETSDAEKFDAAHEPGDTVVEHSYRSILSKLNDSVRKPSVYDLEPNERVVLHIVTLWAGVAVAAAKAKAAALESPPGAASSTS
jgi:hypothetical protein